MAGFVSDFFFGWIDLWWGRGASLLVLCTGPRVLKIFACSTQLSMEFILLINVKMPTIVGILAFISILNTTSERLKTRNFLICLYLNVYEQLKFCAQMSWAWKKFYNLGARSVCHTSSLSFRILTSKKFMTISGILAVNLVGLRPLWSMSTHQV